MANLTSGIFKIKKCHLNFYKNPFFWSELVFFHIFKQLVMALQNPSRSSSSSTLIESAAETIQDPGPHHRYAYVTLLMISDSYLPGCLTWASSVIKVGDHRHVDMVCMVTPCVSTEAKQHLNTLFDRVIEVPLVYTKVPFMRTQRITQMYQRWISKACTKWQCMALSEYKQVVFWDADMVLTHSCLNLVRDVKAPAAVFDNPWSNKHCPSKIPNYYEKVQPFQQIPLLQVDQGLVDGFVGCAAVVVLKPSRESVLCMENMLNDLNQYQCPKIFENPCYSGFDEIALAHLWKRLNTPPTFLPLTYAWFPWKPWLLGCQEWPEAFAKSRALHYFNPVKPWMQPRDKWPDLRLWWELADDVKKLYPSLEAVKWLDTSKAPSEVVVEKRVKESRKRRISKVLSEGEDPGVQPAGKKHKKISIPETASLVPKLS